MPTIIGAFVSKRVTSSAKEAERYAYDEGKVKGVARKVMGGFAIGKQRGHPHEVSDGLTVFVE